MQALVRELVLSSPWGWVEASTAVKACQAKGLDEEQTRKVCELALTSGLRVGEVLSVVEVGYTDVIAKG